MKKRSFTQQVKHFASAIDTKTRLYLKIGVGFLAFVVLLAAVMAASVSAGVALGIVSTIAWGALFLKIKVKYPGVYYQLLDYNTILDVAIMVLGLMMFGVTVSGLFAASIAGILVSLGLNAGVGIEKTLLIRKIKTDEKKDKALKTLARDLNVNPTEINLAQLYNISLGADVSVPDEDIVNAEYGLVEVEEVSHV